MTQRDWKISDLIVPDNEARDYHGRWIDITGFDFRKKITPEQFNQGEERDDQQVAEPEERPAQETAPWLTR
jgi:hypothetical protein